MLGRYNSAILNHKYKLLILSRLSDFFLLLAHVIIFRLRGSYLSFGTL